MAINTTTLFTRMGKANGFQGAANTYRGTTLVADVKEYTDEFDNVSNDLLLTFTGIPPALEAAKSSLDGLQSSTKQALTNLVIQMVKDDTLIPNLTLDSALRETIRQMVVASATLDASTVGVTPTAGGSNNGNGTLVASTKRGDGKVNEHCLAETITVECQTDTSEFGASFAAAGQPAAPSKLSEKWPMGSGGNKTLTEVDVDSGANLITNGSFETELEDSAGTAQDIPSGWDVAVGTPGTTLKLTDIEVQTIAITGSPAGGYMVLKYTNPTSKIQYTVPIAPGASASEVQSALRSLTGLDQVEVSNTAGLTPNFTYQATFYGADHGNLAQLTSDNYFTGGSTPTITHATTTTGSTFVFKGGRALEFDSDGSQLTEIRQRLTNLTPLTVYAINLQAMADVVPAAGVITVDWYDGSAVINDDAATANSFTFTGAGLATSYAARNGFFRTPRVLPPIVYLRIRISTAVSAGSSVFIDSVAMAAADELYPGGPYAKLFSGNVRFRKGSNQARGDYFTIAVTNDRAGLLHEWAERNFDLREKGLLIPTDTGGTETIADSLVS